MTRSKYSETWPKFTDMAHSVLLECPDCLGCRTELPIAPTAKSMTYKGQRYVRMEDTRAHLEGSDELAGGYLWDGWCDAFMAQKRAGRVEVSQSHQTGDTK